MVLMRLPAPVHQRVRRKWSLENAMTSLLIAFLGLLACTITNVEAFAQKKRFVLRVHQQALSDGPSPFVMPVQRKGGNKALMYASKIPVFSENDVDSVYTFPARDGSFGAAFQLNAHGRMALDVASAESRGKFLFIFLLDRQLEEIYVDTRVTDGVFVIGRGLNQNDVAVLKREFPAASTK